MDVILIHITIHSKYTEVFKYFFRQTVLYNYWRTAYRSSDVNRHKRLLQINNIKDYLYELYFYNQILMTQRNRARLRNRQF